MIQSDTEIDASRDRQTNNNRLRTDTEYDDMML